MVFWFGKKKKASSDEDPTRAYDGLIEDLERQGAILRKSAATLIAVRGELTRAVEKYASQIPELERRLAAADRAHDAKVVRALTRDLDDARRMKQASEDALASANSDAEVLLEAAEDLSGRVAQLKVERTTARARWSVGKVVTAALRERVDKFDKVLAVDAARDEVERAHALADVYREDRSRAGKA
jgi:phage shock protein A